MRIAIITDAWHPQVNGVVRTYQQTSAVLGENGHEVVLVTPERFPTVPCPTYPSIRLSVLPGRAIGRLLAEARPDAIHIATEGPLGHAARRHCLRAGLRFTTAFHTQFPEYVRARLPVPVSWSYRYLRRFHASAARTMVPTPSQRERLAERGFAHLEVWSRGVDTAVFRPGDKAFLPGPRPVLMYMGRVAIEKNVEAFLALPIPGTKYVVGDGPDLPRLRRRYPHARFVGQQLGDTLARHVAAADVLVFPSRTDTFGVVLLEAMACGVPVAAYPVTGPLDVVEPGRTGALNEDLARAVEQALKLDPRTCVAFARTRTWQACTAVFESLLVRARGGARRVPAASGLGAAR